MSKENLILVPGFPTNSLLLHGLTEYFSDYVNVYVIDLPGFTSAVPALAEINLDQYVKFVETQIQSLALESYWLGGVSFGFAVINRIQPDPRCKGFVAIGPYMGAASLRMSRFKKLFFSLSCRAITTLKLSSRLWSNPLFQKGLLKVKSYPEALGQVLFQQIDSRTFFETAALIFCTHEPGHFVRRLPYILIANKEDDTVAYEATFKVFVENTTQLLVVNTTIEHYPRETTSNYFRERIPEVAAKEVQAFMINPPSPPLSRITEAQPKDNAFVRLGFYQQLMG